MYFNRQGSQQKNWRMFKKGKQILFACSLLLATGLSLAAPRVVQATPVAESSEVGASTDATMFRIRYRETEIFPGAQGSVPAQGRYGVPEPVRFSLAEGDSSIFTVEETTGTVRYRVPSAAQNGDVLEAQIAVRYADQSTATVPLRLTVRFRLADEHRPTYADKIVPPGTQRTTLAVVNADGQAFPEGTSFAVSSQPLSNGVQMVVDPATGEITATISEGVVIGRRYVGTVKVTYSDRSQDTVFPVVIVKSQTADSYNPSYAAMTSPAVTGNPYTRDLETGGQTLPTGTRFEMAPGSHEVLKVNPTTGQLTFTTPMTSQTGAVLSGVVKVIYPDRSVDEIPVSFLVRASEAAAYNPYYSPAEGGRGEVLSLEAKGHTSYPIGTRFTLMKGGNAAVERVETRSGTARVRIPADAVIGSTIEAHVLIQYSDSSTEVLPIRVTVTERQKDGHEPTYADKVVAPGTKTTTLAVANTNGQSFPEGTRFAVASQPSGGGITMAVNETTGEITATIKTTAVIGRAYTGTIRVTYPDNSSETTTATVTAKRPDAENYHLAYNTGSDKKTGVGYQVPLQKHGKTLPAGTRFELPEGTNPIFSVNPETGELSFRVPQDAQTGAILSGKVRVVFPDASVKEVPFTFNVKVVDSMAHNPTYEEQVVEPGRRRVLEINVANGGVALPTGTKFTVSSASHPNAATVDATTGKLTVTVPADAARGTEIKGTIRIAYPDGTIDSSPYKVTVYQPDAAYYQPAYRLSDAPKTSGVSYEIPIEQGFRTLPTGTRFTVKEGTNANITVHETMGRLTVKVPAATATGTVLEGVVVVTYPDNTADELPVSFTAKLADNQQHSPAYEALVGDKGATLTIPLTNNGQSFPEGTRFEQANPVNSAIAIDSATGQATVTIPEDVAGGTILSALVRVTYPDFSIGSAAVKVTVKKNHAETYLLSYDTTGVHPSGITVEQPLQTGGQTLPEDTVFSLEEGGHEAITAVDGQTGKVTIAIPEDAQNGDIIEGNVRATFPDESYKVLPVRVTAKAADSRVHTPSYEEMLADRGTTIQVPITNAGQSFPEGTRFEQVDPANEAVVIDPATGQATVTIPADAVGGAELTVRVRVTYPDFTIGAATVKVTVKVKDFELFDPRYEEQADKLAGTSVVLPVDTGGLVLPEGIGFAMEAGSHEAMSVDATTGAVTVSLPANAQTGDVFAGTVTITYPDGTTDKASVQVTAKAKPVEVPKPQPIATVSMYRLYNQKTNQHFYTGSNNEIALLQSRGWRLEGVAWKTPASKEGTPVYRVWNTKTGERFYTRHQSEVDKLIARGWKNEGIAFFAQDKGQPIYRVRNNKTGKYLLTVHLNEVQKLEASKQWKNEGVAFYGAR